MPDGARGTAGEIFNRARRRMFGFDLAAALALSIPVAAGVAVRFSGPIAQHPIAAFGGVVALVLAALVAVRATYGFAISPVLRRLRREEEAGGDAVGDEKTFRSKVADAVEAFDLATARVLARHREELRVSRAQGEALRRLAESYFGADFARRAEAGEVPMRPERKRVCVVFCELRGFSDVLEAHPGDAAMRVLGEYFQALEEEVTRAHGRIDKFVGETVMCLFGEPAFSDEAPGHALLAVERLRERLGELRERWRKQGGVSAALACSAGLNVGRTVVGDFGSTTRREHTAVGDVVNVASRLCAAAGPGETLIPEAAYHMLGRGAVPRERRVLTLKGKENPVPVISVALEDVS